MIWFLRIKAPALAVMEVLTCCSDVLINKGQQLQKGEKIGGQTAGGTYQN